MAIKRIVRVMGVLSNVGQQSCRELTESLDTSSKTENSYDFNELTRTCLGTFSRNERSISGIVVDRIYGQVVLSERDSSKACCVSAEFPDSRHPSYRW